MNREVRYPETISAAMLASSSGDSITVYPGTYLERVTAKSGVSLYGVGYPTINASGIIGYGSSIEIAGVHDILVQGFNIKGGASPVGWTHVEGIAIRDFATVGGTASYNITIRDCIFEGIAGKISDVNSLGIPLSIYSLGDTRLGHTYLHDVLVEGCRFINNNTSNQVGITAGYINITGNSEYVTIKDCYFYHSQTEVGYTANGINFSGNYTTAWPATPRYCRVVGCEFETPYTDTTLQQSIYLNVVHDIIIERNYINGWSLGPMVAAEGGNMDEFESYNVIFRRNIIRPCIPNYALNVASWSSFYKRCYNVWIDSNTIIGDIYLTDVNGQGPLSGILITNNILTGSINPVNFIGEYSESHNTSSTEIRIDNLYRQTPDWVVYNTQELDYNGTKQKRTRGAEEKQWIRRKPVRRF